MDKTAAIVIGSYLVAFGAGFAVRSLISRWRKRHYEPKLPAISL
jgi:hypothetical protein